MNNISNDSKLIEPNLKIPDFLLQGFRNWKETEYSKDPAKYRTLSELGQNPSTLVIACCDSRVQPSALFSAPPGELFVHRNIANLVPPYYSINISHNGTAAAIEFAVKFLKVQHIVILGHSGCGGIKYCNDMYSQDDKKARSIFIEKWINNLKLGFLRVTSIEPELDRERALEFVAIVASLENLLEFPYIRDTLKCGKLQIHGMWHNIRDGQLMSYNAEEQQFFNVDPD